MATTDDLAVYLPIVNGFLSGNGFGKAAKQLVKEAEKRNISLGGSSASPDLTQLYDAWTRRQTTLDSISDDVESSVLTPSSSEASSDSDSDDEASSVVTSDDDSDSEEKTEKTTLKAETNGKAPVVAPAVSRKTKDASVTGPAAVGTKQGTKRKRELEEGSGVNVTRGASTPVTENAEHPSSSSSDLSSSSESESESQAEPIKVESHGKSSLSERGSKALLKPVKKQSTNGTAPQVDPKVTPKKRITAKKASSSRESSSEDSSSESSVVSSSSDAGSSSEESSDESDADAKKKKTTPSSTKKISKPAKPDTPSSTTLSGTPVTKTEPESSSMHPDRKRKLDDANDANVPGVSEVNGVAKRAKKENVPFSRIPKDQQVDPKLASNKFVPYDYAQRAHEKLIVTKGKGFTKEKNKGKRGSYRGGKIDLTPKGIKFED